MVTSQALKSKSKPAAKCVSRKHNLTQKLSQNMKLTHARNKLAQSLKKPSETSTVTPERRLHTSKHRLNPSGSHPKTMPRVGWFQTRSDGSWMVLDQFLCRYHFSAIFHASCSAFHVGPSEISVFISITVRHQRHQVRDVPPKPDSPINSVFHAKQHLTYEQYKIYILPPHVDLRHSTMFIRSQPHNDSPSCFFEHVVNFTITMMLCCS